MTDWTAALARADAEAPFLSRAMARLPALTDLLASGDGEGALHWAKTQAAANAPDVPTALRRERLAIALAVAIGDLAGAFPLARVVHELTTFADRALDAAIRHAITQRVPGAAPDGFVALALGKQGAEELNYSSDIDPILLFDPQRLARRPRDDPGEAADHLARQIVQILSRVDAEGYVLRVDLRLRPASEVSPLALPVNAALAHYESSALAWERAAFIRARAAAGDITMGEAFLSQIRPFVWRKSLDFGAIAEIGRLTRRIRATHGQVAVPGPGFDVKRGRGGIREVEFFAQTLQLIHGGRNPALRTRGTRESLDALAAAGLVDPADAAMLGAAYDRLRVVEHRLQMISDRQTHTLPENPSALDAVARLDGLPDGATLVAELGEITARVGARYDALIAANPAPPEITPLSTAADPLAARIAGWRESGVRALRSEAAQAAFETVLPALLAAFAAAPDPARALTRFEQLVGHLPSVLNLFHLLAARPGLLEVLVRVLALAPPLADALARRADLLDPLIDTTAFDLPGDTAAIAVQFATHEAGEDYERLLDRVRRRVGEARFTLGVQLIEARQDPIDIAAALCRVAEAAITVLANAAAAEFAQTHGEIPGGELVILGLGRLGGGMLTHASDLDLIYLFTGDHAAESDGRRPLGGTMYFNRLAARVSSALSVPTAEGALYEVDTRLRPQGTQGLLAVSLDSFARYQNEDAWTWEHMALARARVIHGSAEARATVAAIVDPVLRRARDPAKLAADVLDMRAKMAAHKHPAGPLDVKLLRGGLVDLEFLIHFLQLRDGAGLSPDLATAIAAIAVPDAPALAEALAMLTRVLVAARLLAPAGRLPADDAAARALAKACRCGDVPRLMAGIAAARATVAATWQAVFGKDLEITDG